MNKVKIVTNAVCDMTPAQAKACGVIMIPEAIIFEGGQEYLTNVDLTPELLYQKMHGAKTIPTGSHPNAAMYMDAFRAALDECEQVLLVNMTSKMSASLNTAFLARAMLEEENPALEGRIFLYDSLQLCHGLGFLVRRAAAMAQAGTEAEAILAELDAVRDKIGEYFVMKSLENAAKGGRLGLIRTVAADMLGVKPVLMFRDGINSEVGICRKFKAALDRLAQIYDSRAEKGREVIVFHANSLDDAEYVKAKLLELDPAAQVSIEWLGSGIGIYTGEGTIGVTFWEP